MGKIVAVSVSAIVVIVAVLAVTKIGHVIDAATQHFMLYYAGVLALIGLTGSVLVSLIAADRIVMTPGHRVMAQAVHRAFAFGTLAFLIIHIATEILAQRSHALDAVVPFLSPFRTFYIGLGTIASDLIVLLVITGIIRKRFTAHGKAWRWRAIHYSSYVAFVFGVLHGLLGGRAAKPYVDWSYGFAIAVTALGLALRFLAVSLRPKESLSTSPIVDRAGSGSASPMRSAAMAMAQAQLSGAQFGGSVQVLPAALGAGRGADTGSWTATALPTPGRSPASGPLPALGPAAGYGAESGYGAEADYGAASDYGAAPAYVGAPPVMDAYGAVPDPYSPAPDAYDALGFTPLGAPPYGDDPQNGMRARPYVSAEPSRPAVAGPARQPRYEPGYDGPPRFEGAPRGQGDVPQDALSSYPYGPPGRQAKPISPYPEDYQDRGAPEGRTAPWPGPMEPAPPRAAIAGPSRPGDRGSGPQPQFGSGPMPRPDTGSIPRVDSGPMPRPDTGSIPRVGGGQPPRRGTGPMPRAGTGPMPRPDSGPSPAPRPGTGPVPRPDTGSMPRVDTGSMPRPDTGSFPRVDTGPMPRPDTGSMPRVGDGQPSRHGTGPTPRTSRRGTPRADTGSMPRLGTEPMAHPGTGPMPRPDTGPRPATRSGPRHGRPVAEPVTGPRTGSQPRPSTRPSHRAQSTDPRYRDIPGPTGGGEWE
jgi:DMSO/TMAO reductase YedYZ heme-binding membrane subunit